MPNPMKTLLPLAAGLVLGTWFAKRPVPAPSPYPLPARRPGRHPPADGAAQTGV